MQQTREQKRASIEAAAYRCFMRAGYHQTSVDDICAAAGISKGSFYWYFAGKQAIFHQILTTWVGAVEARLERGFGSAAAIPDAFEALTKAMEAEIGRNRSLLPVLLEFMSHADRDADIRAGLAQLHERAHHAVARFLAHLFHDKLTDMQRQALATMIMATFIGLSCEAMFTQQQRDPNLHLERFMEAVALRFGSFVSSRTDFHTPQESP